METKQIERSEKRKRLLHLCGMTDSEIITDSFLAFFLRPSQREAREEFSPLFSDLRMHTEFRSGKVR